MPHKCLSIIILDFIIYAYEKCYPQIFLEECRYVKENIKTKYYIDGEFDIDTDTNHDNDIDIDIDNKE